MKQSIIRKWVHDKLLWAKQTLNYSLHSLHSLHVLNPENLPITEVNHEDPKLSDGQMHIINKLTIWFIWQVNKAHWWHAYRNILAQTNHIQAVRRASMSYQQTTVDRINGLNHCTVSGTDRHGTFRGSSNVLEITDTTTRDRQQYTTTTTMASGPTQSQVPGRARRTDR